MTAGSWGTSRTSPFISWAPSGTRSDRGPHPFSGTPVVGQVAGDGGADERGSCVVQLGSRSRAGIASIRRGPVRGRDKKPDVLRQGERGRARRWEAAGGATERRAVPQVSPIEIDRGGRALGRVPGDRLLSAA